MTLMNLDSRVAEQVKHDIIHSINNVSLKQPRVDWSISEFDGNDEFKLIGTNVQGFNLFWLSFVFHRVTCVSTIHLDKPRALSDGGGRVCRVVFGVLKKIKAEDNGEVNGSKKRKFADED